jgi:hypothetical protein
MSEAEKFAVALQAAIEVLEGIGSELAEDGTVQCENSSSLDALHNCADGPRTARQPSYQMSARL